MPGIDSKITELLYDLSVKVGTAISNNYETEISFNSLLSRLNGYFVNTSTSENLNLRNIELVLSNLHILLDKRTSSTEDLSNHCVNYSSEIKSSEMEFCSHFDMDTFSDNNLSFCENSSENNDSVKLKTKTFSIQCRNNDNVMKIKSKYGDTNMLNNSSQYVRNTKMESIPTKHKVRKINVLKSQNLYGNRKPKELRSIRTRKITQGNRKFSGNDNSKINQLRSRSRISSHVGSVGRKKHEDNIIYCICKRPSFGDMIACDNKNCDIEWFHYKCVDITKSPDGEWFCPKCDKEYHL